MKTEKLKQSGSESKDTKHRRQTIPDSRRIIRVTATRAAMASGHVRAEALGFTKSGRLVHFDGRETKPVSLKQSVEIVARFNIGLQQEVWDGETRHDAPWVKWLRMLAKAIR